MMIIMKIIVGALVIANLLKAEISIEHHLG